MRAPVATTEAPIAAHFQARILLSAALLYAAKDTVKLRRELSALASACSSSVDLVCEVSSEALSSASSLLEVVSSADSRVKVAAEADSLLSSSAEIATSRVEIALHRASSGSEI